LYIIIIESLITTKTVRLIQMCLNETYGGVRVGKFPIKNGFKQGDALPPLLFSFILEYPIERAELNRRV
jgi:hypothetical protein